MRVRVKVPSEQSGRRRLNRIDASSRASSLGSNRYQLVGQGIALCRREFEDPKGPQLRCQCRDRTFLWGSYRTEWPQACCIFPLGRDLCTCPRSLVSCHRSIPLDNPCTRWKRPHLHTCPFDSPRTCQQRWPDWHACPWDSSHKLLKTLQGTRNPARSRCKLQDLWKRKG